VDSFVVNGCNTCNFVKVNVSLEKKELVGQIKDLLYQAKKQKIYLGDILLELLKDEDADSEFEHILSRQLMGPDRESAIKGYLFALQYTDKKDHFITYKGNGQAIAGLLSLIAKELTRREDVGIFIARLVGTAINETEEIFSQ